MCTREREREEERERERERERREMPFVALGIVLIAPQKKAEREEEKQGRKQPRVHTEFCDLPRSPLRTSTTKVVTTHNLKGDLW